MENGIKKLPENFNSRIIRIGINKDSEINYCVIEEYDENLRLMTSKGLDDAYFKKILNRFLELVD